MRERNERGKRVGGEGCPPTWREECGAHEVEALQRCERREDGGEGGGAGVVDLVPAANIGYSRGRGWCVYVGGYAPALFI